MIWTHNWSLAGKQGISFQPCFPVIRSVSRTVFPSKVGFPISLVKSFFVFPIFEFDCRMDKMKSHSLRTSKTFILNSFLVFPRPVNFVAVVQPSVGMKNSQKLSSKTSSETRLLTVSFQSFIFAFLVKETA